MYNLNKTILPHNLQDQAPPVDPFDRELPIEYKCYIFNCFIY